MPPASVVRVQGDTISTRWTLSSLDQDDDPYGDGGKHASPIIWEEKMQANGFHHPQYHEPTLPRYASYEGSDYGSPTLPPRQDADVWKPPVAVNGGGGPYDDFDFSHSPLSERPSHAISVDTRVRNENRDSVGQHLLYETALLDSAHYEILDISEVDGLKKELVRLNTRIQSAERSLALESKVKDAAHNLQRLYARNRPDTPQMGDDQRGARSSTFGSQGQKGSRTSAEAESIFRADSELAQSIRKVDELNETIKELLDRRQDVERRLLKHTAAVLAEEANGKVTSAVPGLTNGNHSDDRNSMYMPDDFDGIRSILHGMPQGSGHTSKEHEQQLASMQNRLDQLNVELRNVIDEAGRTLGKNAPAEAALNEGDDSASRIENRFVRLEASVEALKQQQSDLRASHARIQGSEHEIEEQMQSLNKQLHENLLLASTSQPLPDLQEPPQTSGQGSHQQMEYMEEHFMTLEQLLQQHSHTLSEGGSKAAQKLEECETVLAGLWDILQSETARRPNGADDENSPQTPISESFSLQAFNSQVQHLFSRAQSAKEQQDILRRQIQQQRDLNGRSDAEKDQQTAELRTRYDQLVADRDALQDELARVMVQHQQSETEASRLRSELSNVMKEYEIINKAVDAKQKEHEDMARSLHAKIAEHEERATEQEDMENLESEVVRLTTELTMAKADLDVAKGSRAERAGAQAAEVEFLQKELGEMTSEFQELTRESIELEKERESLDALIDSLRERCEALESQLDDEKVRWLGVKNPNVTGADGNNGGREMTSLMVLRQEFKKMMREARAEGTRVLKAEQESRRKLEADLRKIRQANGPLAKSLSVNNAGDAGATTMAGTAK